MTAPETPPDPLGFPTPAELIDYREEKVRAGASLTGVTWSATICPDGTNSDDDRTCAGHVRPG